MQITDYHAKYYAHELTKRCSSDSLEKLTTSLMDAQVDLNPHQVEAALFAFKSPFSTGAMLADEVGLRPAKKQFQIYWQHNSRQYVPDFVAETADTIYMVETKKKGDIETSEVQEKATAAAEYCKHATDFTTQNNGKPWAYVIIPHNAVLANMGLRTLVDKYEHRSE